LLDWEDVVMSSRDAEIWERHSRGESLREIAEAMGLSKSYVHKIVDRLRSVAPVDPDPVLSLLSPAEWSAAGVDVGELAARNALSHYRFQRFLVVEDPKVVAARNRLAGQGWDLEALTVWWMALPVESAPRAG
jgi:transcriptional regulator with XRE-family HTH domain